MSVSDNQSEKKEEKVQELQEAVQELQEVVQEKVQEVQEEVQEILEKLLEKIPEEVITKLLENSPEQDVKILLEKLLHDEISLKDLQEEVKKIGVFEDLQLSQEIRLETENLDFFDDLVLSEEAISEEETEDEYDENSIYEDDDDDEWEDENGYDEAYDAVYDDGDGDGCGTLTKDMLITFNQIIASYEEVFNNQVAYALHQETLTQNTELYKTAEELLLKINQGYLLNLNNSDFIKHTILMYQYGEGDIYPKLFEKLPEFLKIILTYHAEKEMPTHFWINSLMTSLSIRDLMNVFNLQPSEEGNIHKDRLALEPYYIILETALQQFDFDTGKKNKSNIFTHFLNARLSYLEFKRSKHPYVKDITFFVKAYPYTYRFLVETAISADYGRFLNGLVTLKNMVFGGPSDEFVDAVTRALIESKAYTIPFSDYSIPLPIPLPFPMVEAMHSTRLTPFVMYERNDID